MVASLTVLALSLLACGSGQQAATDEASPESGNEATEESASEDSDSGVSGEVTVDGSSTVFPISEAMAEEFMKANDGVQVTVGVSGTGGGFKKFCAGETDISNASRPIKQEEIELCEENGIEYVEVPIAYDGLTVVVHPDNELSCMTVEELKIMWEPDAQGKIVKWNQVNPDFPDATISLYGAGTDSGTYDYFTAAIVGEEGASRGDYTASEDDNVLVQGVASDPNAIGFFGYAYYIENEGKLKALEIDGGNGCVAPSEETIADGSYAPLSRPEFFYVKKESLENNPAVEAFARFMIDPDNASLIEEVGYVPLPSDLNDVVAKLLDDKKTGTVFEGGSAVGLKLADLLKKES